MSKSESSAESLDWMLNTINLPLKHLKLVQTDISKIINTSKIPAGAVKADIYPVLNLDGMPINYSINYFDNSGKVNGHEFLYVDNLRK